MPSYIYRCLTCKSTVQRLVASAVRDTQICRACGLPLVRNGSEGFVVNTPLDTTKKDAYSATEIDKVIGASASIKWEALNKKKEKKLAGKNIVDVGIKPGETFNPEHFLGSAKRKEQSKTFSKAVSETKTPKEDLTQMGFKKIDI